MSVLIKGMKMPKKCEYAEIRVAWNGDEWLASVKLDEGTADYYETAEIPDGSYIIIPNSARQLNDI